MITTYQVGGYHPNKVRSRYVRRGVETGYHFAEVGDDRRFDLRQGTVSADELPEAVRVAADLRCGFFPSYVDWPVQS